MFDIGFLELMVVAVLGLLVLGPERLPVAARSLGLLFGKVRRTVNNVQDELERQVRAEELREKLKDPYATFLDDDDDGNRIQPHQSAPSGTQKPDAPNQTAPVSRVEALAAQEARANERSQETTPKP